MLTPVTVILTYNKLLKAEAATKLFWLDDPTIDCMLNVKQLMRRNLNSPILNDRNETVPYLSWMKLVVHRYRHLLCSEELISASLMYNILGWKMSISKTWKPSLMTVSQLGL